MRTLPTSPHDTSCGTTGVTTAPAATPHASPTPNDTPGCSSSATSAPPSAPHALVTIFNAGYAVGNVTLSVGWLFALYRRGSPAYARERRATGRGRHHAAVPVFATFPTAPPRSLDGFIDTLRAKGIDLDHPVLVRLYNPITAMPSYHMAFAVVTGLGVASRGRSRAVRFAGRAYPVAVAAVVIGTGNHFVADVAAGSALGAVARAVTR